MNIQQGSLSRYILVVLCIAVVFTTLVLVALNSWMKNKQLSGIPAIDQVLSGQSYDDGYKAGFLAAREKFLQTPPIPQNVDIKLVSGTIQSISDDSLSLLVTSLDTDPMVDGVSDTRTVLIDKNTKIEKRVTLPMDEFNKRMRTWNEDASKKDSTPPLPYLVTPLSLSDLKVGMQISASSDESLRLKESFTASVITASQTVEVK